MARDEFRLAASSGWKLVDDTSAHTDAHYGIQAREDTVITAWTAGGQDLVARFGLSTKTIGTDDPAILIPSALVNAGAQSITLASGSINLLLQ
jgi:hypothetical protein